MLDRARELARSGHHRDHNSIEQQLRSLEEFPAARQWIEDRRFRAQLDKLCADARRKGGDKRHFTDEEGSS